MFIDSTCFRNSHLFYLSLTFSFPITFPFLELCLLVFDLAFVNFDLMYSQLHLCCSYWLLFYNPRLYRFHLTNFNNSNCLFLIKMTKLSPMHIFSFPFLFNDAQLLLQLHSFLLSLTLYAIFLLNFPFLMHFIPKLKTLTPYIQTKSPYFCINFMNNQISIII